VVDIDIDMTSKQRSGAFILVLIDFSYTTSYRLSTVTFALWDAPFSHNTFRTDDRRTQHCSISATVG